jgi:phospholipid-translocating ATPase
VSVSDLIDRGTQLILYHSWTLITWIVVFGSSIVMLLWIVIYSFFTSPDFINEVVVLFGEVTFWATVLATASIALSEQTSLLVVTY